MPTIKLTAKRQATIPVAVCKEMNLHPGDEITVERCVINGEPHWIMKNRQDLAFEWFGALREYAKGKQHDMKSIRRSVASGRNKDGKS